MSSSSLLTGPAEVPAGADCALVCLHGFGDVGQSWLDLLRLMKPALPETFQTKLALFGPNAPEPTPFGQGLQWFRDNGWTFRDPAGLKRAAGLLEQYLTQTVVDEHRIARSRTIVMGFSQGGMVSLYAVPRMNPPVAGHIALCSALMDETRPDPLTLTPTLLLHGADDDVLSADATVKTSGIYESWGIPTETHLLPGLGHGADAQALAHIAAFIQDILK